jgi:hypothetical protein
MQWGKRSQKNEPAIQGKKGGNTFVQYTKVDFPLSCGGVF